MVCPGGYKPEAASHLSIFLHCVEGNQIRADYTVTLIHPTGGTSAKESITDRKFTASEEGYGWHQFITHEALQAYLANDTLTMDLEITAHDTIFRSIPPLDRRSIRDDVQDLYATIAAADPPLTTSRKRTLQSSSDDNRNESSADVDTLPFTPDVHIVTKSTTACDGTEERSQHPAHKLILSMRSPVFKAMFSAHMSEATSNEVLIPDIDTEVMREFLAFLYTDKCDAATLDKHGEQLLAAASKYQVLGLEEVCVHHLQTTLTAENVFSRLLLADLHGYEELKLKALQFVVKDKQLVRLSSKWLKNMTADLMDELMNAISDQLVK